MEKSKLIVEILNHLEKELDILKAATLATYDAATNEESKAENQYDTRALEASYLAGAQAQRLNEIEELIFIYKSINLRKFSPEDPVDLTALLELQSNGNKTWVLIMPKGGGIKVNFNNKPVQTLTPSSPLGEALMTLKIGDVAVVEEKSRSREYEILSIN